MRINASFVVSGTIDALLLQRGSALMAELFSDLPDDPEYECERSSVLENTMAVPPVSLAVLVDVGLTYATIAQYFGVSEALFRNQGEESSK